MTPSQLANFFHMTPPPPKKKIYIYKITLSQYFTFFNILCYSLIHPIVLAMKTIFTISNTTKSSLSDSTNQKKEKSISNLLVIVHPERVAFGLSLASSLSESQINAKMTSLESSPPESMASLSYSSFSLSSV